MTGTAGSLVVGVDGSAGARTALEYALGEALVRQVPVVVVTAYEPALVGTTATGVVPDAHDDQRLARQTAQTEVDTVLGALPEDRRRQLDLSIDVRSGPAPAVLTHLSRDAGALIVGHRGRGGLASHLIGSVGLSCVVHAETTVVVVRG
jgi:nucleotide-binding universal stress UspA family protein